MITFPPTSLRNHTTSSYELSNKVSRLKLSSASSSMVSFSISWQEKSNTIITGETSTQRRPQVSWTQIHRSDAEMRIKVARLGSARQSAASPAPAPHRDSIAHLCTGTGATIAEGVHINYIIQYHHVLSYTTKIFFIIEIKCQNSNATLLAQSCSFKRSLFGVDVVVTGDSHPNTIHFRVS